LKDASSREKRQTTRSKGDQAEQIVARYLESRGYKILDRNFSCRLGEIDIVAMHRDELVFVEVRAKYSANTVDPVYSVNLTKQKRIIRAALTYMGSRLDSPYPMRFDVAVVNMREPRTVELIPNAFGAESMETYR
jgi:putative endonuclease